MRLLLGLLGILCLLSGCGSLSSQKGVHTIDKRPTWQKTIDPRGRIFYDPELVYTHPSVI